MSILNAMTIVTEIYKATQSFPVHEQYGLSSQMRRCAVSIPSNIAEGYGRESDREKIRFLDIARGSLYELNTQLEIAYRLEYLESGNIDSIGDLTDETSRMLTGLKKSLKKRL